MDLPRKDPVLFVQKIDFEPGCRVLNRAIALIEGFMLVTLHRNRPQEFRLVVGIACRENLVPYGSVGRVEAGNKTEPLANSHIAEPLTLNSRSKLVTRGRRFDRYAKQH